MSRPPRLWPALAAVGLLHGLVLLAGPLSPYDPVAQDRQYPWAPPTRLHWTGRDGGLTLLPSVCRWRPRPGAFAVYDEDCGERFPLRFWVRGARYQLPGGLVSDLHLVGVTVPGRLFLLGTDGLGRDVLSRLLAGGRISLAAGLLATGLSLSLGLVLGALAGFFGGRVDDLLMRGTDLFLALPWLYLLLAVRAFLPLHLEPQVAFLVIVAVLGAVGWARPARLVRGVALAARERRYVLAARGFGASNLYLLRRHVLPQTSGVVLTQAALLVPHYVLAEVTLSFLGLGVGEPTPSWGSMLADLQRYHVLVSYGWMLAPAAALVVIFTSYHKLADTLHRRWAE